MPREYRFLVEDGHGAYWSAVFTQAVDPFPDDLAGAQLRFLANVSPYGAERSGERLIGWCFNEESVRAGLSEFDALRAYVRRLRRDLDGLLAEATDAITYRFLNLKDVGQEQPSGIDLSSWNVATEIEELLADLAIRDAHGMWGDSPVPKIWTGGHGAVLRQTDGNAHGKADAFYKEYVALCNRGGPLGEELSRLAVLGADAIAALQRLGLQAGAMNHCREIGSTERVPGGAIADSEGERSTSRQCGAITWLHLSDLHIGQAKNVDWRELSDALMADLRAHRRPPSQQGKEHAGETIVPDLVFVTGDVAWSGDGQEYELAKEFFVQLWRTLGWGVRLGRSRTYCVPGNHDVSRPAAKGSRVHRRVVRELTSHEHTEESLYRRIGRFCDSSDEFAPFIDKMRHYRTYAAAGALGGAGETCFVQAIEVSSVRLEIVGINTSWTSWQNGEDGRRELLISPQQTNRLVTDRAAPGVTRIALMHHPFDAVHPADPSRARLTELCPLILHGHVHQPRLDGGLEPGREHVILPGGSVHEGGRWKAQRYTFGRFDTGTGELTVWLRKTTTGAWPRYVCDVESYPSHGARLTITVPRGGTGGMAELESVAPVVDENDEPANNGDYFESQLGDVEIVQRPKTGATPILICERFGADWVTESVEFFEERLAANLPGSRGLVGRGDKEAMDFLEGFLMQPLLIADSTAFGAGHNDPVWWWRGSSSMGIERFQRISDARCLADCYEWVLNRVVVYRDPNCKRSFIYIETSADSPARPADYAGRDAPRVEEYGELHGNAISRAELDDGYATIDGRIVDARSARLRVRYLAPRNFVIAPKGCPLNAMESERGNEERLNQLLDGSIDLDSYVDWYLSLPAKRYR